MLNALRALVRPIWSRYPWVFTWILPLLFLLGCTLYYQGTAANCSDLLMDGPGDQTAGLIWLHSVSPEKPLWGFSHITNYPFGESLHQPAQWSGSLLYFWYWLLAKMAGAVCGYNLLNITGFLSAAVIMYAFVKWLTKQPLIALLAGYAVAFTPYLQIKTSVHTSYAYEGVFILAIWLFMMFWRRPTWWLAVGLGGLLGATFYMDPYFVLLATVLMVALFGAAIGYDLATKQPGFWLLRDKRALIGLILLVGAAVLLPLVYIRLHYSAAINQFVSSSRNPVKLDAQIYGARPWEYFVPAENNQVLKALLGPTYGQNRDHHISNPAEYTINLSLTLIVLILVTAGILYRRRHKRQPFWPANMPLRAPPGPLVAAVATIGLLAFTFSLAPTIHNGIKLPTYYLTSIITMWRVFARLSVLVNISLVLLSVVALAALWPLIRRQSARVGLVLVILAGVVLEYQVYPISRPVWSFSANTPPIYYWLNQQKDIKVVAEYSLDEEATSPFPVFDRTFDIIDHKQMLNSTLPNSPQGPLRGALRTLTDPQTIPVLRTLGVDTVIVHGVTPLPDIPGLQLVQQETSPPPTASPSFPPFAKYFPIGVYRVLDGPKANYETTLETGFVYPKVDSPIQYEYAGGNGAVLDLRPLPGGPTSGTGQMCFTAKAFNQPVDVMFTVNGREVWHGSLGDSYQPVQLPVALGQPVALVTSRPAGVAVLFTNLGGCSQ